MKSGYVYVISTDLYRGRDIYKIGFTDNLERRMKQFNNTRTDDDQFYIVNCWKTVRYMTLETRIHRALAEHHLKNELFQCPLEKINDTVKQIFNKNSFFNHHDLVIEAAEAATVKWNQKQGYFSIRSRGIEVMMNEKNMVTEVRNWISVNDKHNLYQFICPSYFDEMISFLKEKYSTDDVDELVTSVKDMALAAPSLNEQMRTLKIGN